MNILQIHNLYRENGGEDAVAASESRLLQDAGHTVYTCHATNNVGVSEIHARRKQYFRKIQELLENFPVEVAHLHNVYQVIGNAIYPFLKARQIPIVQTLHNYRLLCSNATLLDNRNTLCEACKTGYFVPGVLKKCYRNSYLQSGYMAMQVAEGRRLALRHVDVFIAVSQFVKDKHVEAGFPEERIVVKPNFVPPVSLPPKTEEAAAYALFIGRLAPGKGLHTLLSAFRDLPFRLRMAGTGPLEEALKKQYSAPNIQFDGFISGPEKQQLIRQAALVVVPSEWYEPFGLVVREAQQLGTPVIVSDAGALPGLITENDLVFRSGDAVHLRAQIQQMMERKEQAGIRVYQPVSEAEAADALIVVYQKSSAQLSPLVAHHNT